MDNIFSFQTRKDNITRTGTGGGADCKLTDVDEEVLTIIGKDSASICGLDVQESLEEILSSEQYEPELILIEETSVASRNLPTESVPSTSTCQPAEYEKPPSSSTYTTKTSEIPLGTSRTSDFRRNPQVSLFRLILNSKVNSFSCSIHIY